MKKKLIKVEQDIERPVETKILAQAIVDVSKAMKALAASGLNQKAIVVLVAHNANQPMYVVKQILESIAALAKTYTLR